MDRTRSNSIWFVDRKPATDTSLLPQHLGLHQTGIETDSTIAAARRISSSTFNPVRAVQILDEQQTGRAANRTTSVPDLSPLTAMTIGLLGLDRLRNPGLFVIPRSQQRSGKSLEHGVRFVNHTLFKKSEDCEPRIGRIGRIGRAEISRF